MPLFEENDENPTEAPTTYRREEFRKQGMVAISRELLSVLLLLALLGTLTLASGWIYEGFRELIRKFLSFGLNGEFSKADFLEMKNYLALHFFRLVAPVFGVGILAGLAASMAQAGFYITWEPLAPNWDRLNPIEGMQRLLSLKGFAEALKAVLKIAIVTWVVWLFIKSEVFQVGFLIEKGVGESSVSVLSETSRLALYVLLALGVVAIGDYFFQRYQMEKKMMMTRREMKNEYKLREGDPLIKSRIRNIQRKIASRRMMENIPKAAVVITNPTHLAIALQYETGMEAPKVVAKGAGAIAMKIREVAKFNGVPIVENKPLARTLYKTLDLGEYIPKDLYKAVAEVLSYVYKLKGRWSQPQVQTQAQAV